MAAEAQPAAATVPPIPDVLPVLPLRGGTVVFPLAVVPLLVGQERSVRLVDDVMRGDRLLVLVAQRDEAQEQPRPDELHRIGTVGIIHQLVRAPDGTLRLVLQGLERVRQLEFPAAEPYLTARIEPAPDSSAPSLETEALRRAAVDLYRRVVGLVEQLPDELAQAAESLADPRQLAYLVASTLPLSTVIRQELLELDPIDAKLRRLIDLLQRELSIRELGQKITNETREQMSKAQRDYFLR